MRQITHRAHGLTVVMREKTGGDELDRSELLRAIAFPVADQMGIEGNDRLNKIPLRIWTRIGHVADVIQLTVTFEGEGCFDIPPAHADNETLFDFYTFLMAQPAKYVQFFQAAVKKLGDTENADPNATGETHSDPSQRVSSPVLPESLS